jgi:hypothetical protein
MPLRKYGYNENAPSASEVMSPLVNLQWHTLASQDSMVRSGLVIDTIMGVLGAKPLPFIYTVSPGAKSTWSIPSAFVVPTLAAANALPAVMAKTPRIQAITIMAVSFVAPTAPAYAFMFIEKIPGMAVGYLKPV